MYDYSKRIEAFWDEKVCLREDSKNKLFNHRKVNRDRLIKRLPEEIEGLSIGESSFKPQGSMAMKTIIQARFLDEEYDIDDGLVLWKSDLINAEGNELSAMDVKNKVREALKDNRFNRQPRLCTNCVRVFYADGDEEKHHVDFPVYRKYNDGEGKYERELASGENWTVSDPTQVTVWFESEVTNRNYNTDGKGTQMRRLVQLLKRFCRSQRNWDLPNGMKLTMLVSECQPEFSSGLDIAFRNLLKNLKKRLECSKVIFNLAHPDNPQITRTLMDDSVCQLLEKIKEALEKLEILDNIDCKQSDASTIWDWVFKSDGFFKKYDENNNDSQNVSNFAAGIAVSTPKGSVDHRGGGRFG